MIQNIGQSVHQDIVGFLVAFVVGHPLGTYRALNPKTQKNSLTGDVTFFNKSNGEWAKIEKLTFVWVTDGGSNDDDGEQVPKNNDRYNIVTDSNDWIWWRPQSDPRDNFVLKSHKSNEKITSFA